MIWTFSELVVNLWTMFKYIISAYTSLLAVTMFLGAAQ